MVKFLRPAALLLVAAIAVPVLAQTNTENSMHNAMSKTSLNINMGQQNDSKQDGTATIKAVEGGILVTVSLTNTPANASEPAHIHQGTCAKLNPAPWKPLNNVVDGKSVTTVKGVTIADLKKSHYAVNVHKSAADLATYVSCGDI